MEELVYHVYRDVVTNDGDCFSGAWGVGGDADGVRRVVEVDHVDVKHQHGRAWDIP